MKPIPVQVEPVLIPGLKLAGRGKVCEIYELKNPWFDLKVPSDRVSVHDIILPFHVPHKGEVLNLVDLFWRKQFPNICQDVVVVGREIDGYIPRHLWGRFELYSRARIIRRCGTVSAELIYRWLLTGTGLKKYRQNGGVVCGQQFPKGLREWDELTPTAFTPTTKDPDGHDEHMDISVFIDRFGNAPIELTRSVFEIGKTLAARRGIIIADTKFEVGHDIGGQLTLIDEVLTPDSSRYLREEDVFEARRSGKRPPSFDKQPIRDYVSKYLDVGPETPLTSKVIARVHGHKFPEDLIVETSARYTELLKLLTGKTLDEHVAVL